MYDLNFARLVGLAGFFIGITGLLQKNDHSIRMRMALFDWTMAIHFLMLGSVTSAIGTCASGTRSYISTNYQTRYPLIPARSQ